MCLASSLKSISFHLWPNFIFDWFLGFLLSYFQVFLGLISEFDLLNFKFLTFFSAFLFDFLINIPLTLDFTGTIFSTARFFHFRFTKFGHFAFDLSNLAIICHAQELYWAQFFPFFPPQESIQFNWLCYAFYQHLAFSMFLTVFVRLNLCQLLCFLPIRSNIFGKFPLAIDLLACEPRAHRILSSPITGQ